MSMRLPTSGGSFLLTRFVSALLLLLAFLIAPAPAQAQGANDQYLQILNTIREAETLTEQGKNEAARAKYQDARTALLEFRKRYPAFNPKLVAHRQSEVNEKLATLSAPPPAAETPRRQTAASPPPPEVKLLEAGAEPRRALRYSVAPGDKQALRMSVMTEVEMAGQSMKVPPIQMDLGLTVKSVSDEEIAYEAVINDATVADAEGVMPEVAAAIKMSFAGLKGVSVAGVITSQGQTLSSKMGSPRSGSRESRQQVQQVEGYFSSLGTPLPRAPVGVGAQWEARQMTESQGMKIDVITIYEVVSMEGDEVQLKCSLVQSAANQKIQNPAFPGMQVELSKLAGRGSGTVSLDLTKVGPLLAVLDSDVDMAMAMNLGGSKQPMEMKNKVEVRFETR